MRLLLAHVVVIGLLDGTASAGTTITPLQGSIGNPFNDGSMHGWGWSGDKGGGAGPLIGNLYDNILTINGGAATGGLCNPFTGCGGHQAFIDWDSPTAQLGDDLHGLAGPTQGGPTAIITSIRYAYRNTVATATHRIRIYDMVPPSVNHPSAANTQFGAQLLDLTLPGVPTGAAIVTVTGLSVHAGVAAWIKFGESGPGFPGTFWLAGGVGNGVGTTHYGFTYSDKDYYGPGQPLHSFRYYPYFYVGAKGYIVPNLQVALSGFVMPAPATICLLGLGGLVSLRRRQRPR